MITEKLVKEASWINEINKLRDIEAGKCRQGKRIAFKAAIKNFPKIIIIEASFIEDYNGRITDHIVD